MTDTPVASTVAHDDSRSAGTRRGWDAVSRRRALAIGAFVLVAVPLVVAVAALHSPRWYPIGDLAQTELRVRDVGTGNSPMIGLVGRLGTLEHPGSHPGPLSFWLLAPIYRLLGASSFGLIVSTVALHLIALGLALWIACRRAGPWLAVALAAGVVWLGRAYSQEVLTAPWNPFLPVTWWLVLLLALWSLLCDDEVMLPIAVVAGSFCAQTHIPYLGLFGGLVVCTGVPLLIVAWRRWRARDDETGDEATGHGWPHLWWWVLGSAALGIVLWLPPIIQQLTNDPGNLTVIKDSLTHHTQPAVGVGEGLKVLLQNLDPLALFTHRSPRILNDAGASVVPGAILVVAWLASAVLAWQQRRRRLVTLDGVLLAALALGWLSISRIFGEVWTYLLLWSWGLAMLLLVATIWSVVTWWSSSSPRPAQVAFAVLAGVGLVVGSAAFTADNVDAQVALPDLNLVQGSLARQTVRYLDRPGAVGGGRDGRYVVSWTDPLYLGTYGYGLLDELERQEFHVGVDELNGPGAGKHRVLAEADATGRLQVVVGPAIADYDKRPDLRRIAYVDPRSPAQVRLFERLRQQVLATARTLDVAGLDQFDSQLFATANRSDLPTSITGPATRMAAIGLPSAVYVSRH